MAGGAPTSTATARFTFLPVAGTGVHSNEYTRSDTTANNSATPIRTHQSPRHRSMVLSAISDRACRRILTA